MLSLSIFSQSHINVNVIGISSHFRNGVYICNTLRAIQPNFFTAKCMCPNEQKKKKKENSLKVWLC